MASAQPLVRAASDLEIGESRMIRVAFDQVSYEVGPANNTKEIIHNVDFAFEPGRLTALMGPSGSGKTTLLNILLGNASGTITQGTVMYNQREGIPDRFKSHAKLIPQEDVLLPAFTVEETLSYQAELMGLTGQAGKERVEAVLEALSLTECRDVRIGDAIYKGISGGQRKRVSIGLELLADPSVLCVDEPTSGLDSSTAEDVVRILASLATKSKRTVIVTIHQPSWRIFQNFNDVVYITAGRIAYAGPVSAVETWFASTGHETPNKTNPCDFHMRLLQDEDVKFALTSKWAEKIANEQAASSAPRFLQKRRTSVFSRTEDYPTSFWQQTKTLTKRTFVDNIKDKSKFARMLVGKIGVAAVIGSVWFQKANPPTNETILPVQGALFGLLMNSTIDTLVQTVLVFPISRLLLLRQYRNGTYRLMAFYVSQQFVLFCLALFYVSVSSVPVFFLVGFDRTGDKLPLFVAVIVCMTNIGNSVGLIVGAVSKDIQDAQSKLVPIFLPLVLFSGLLLPYGQIAYPFRPFYWVSFFRMALTALEVNQFADVEFDDYNLDLKDLPHLIQHPEDIHPLKYGRQFLKTVQLDADVSPWWYVLQLALYGVVLQIVGYYIVKRAVRHPTG